MKPSSKLNGPRCSATTKAGKPCQALAGADGLCTAHSGKVDMCELGHRGGRSRRKGVTEELPERERQSLREFLGDGLDHDVILGAVQQALAGGNESARVACVKFLSELELYRKDGDECPRCAAMKAEGPANRAAVDQMISRLVEFAVKDEFGVARPGGRERHDRNDSQVMRLVRAAVRRGLEGHEQDLQQAVHAAVTRIIDALGNGLVPGDVGTERAQAILAQL